MAASCDRRGSHWYSSAPPVTKGLAIWSEGGIEAPVWPRAGAELENLVNEAAISAVRNSRQRVVVSCVHMLTHPNLTLTRTPARTRT